MTDYAIPITVGVTGHRDLRPEDTSRLAELVRERLRELRSRYPHSPIMLLSSLAEGADQLCAEAALSEGCSLSVPLPMPAEAYTKEFSPEGKSSFEALLHQAKQSFVVPFEEPEPEEISNGYRYRQAGIYIALHSHILLALWDGEEKRSPEGGGTFETVDFMLHEGWRKRDGREGGIFKPPGDGLVWHIMTPRQSGPADGEWFGMRTLSNSGDDPWPAALSETDGFNADLERHAERIESGREQSLGGLMDEKSLHALSPHARALAGVFSSADCLSLYFRNLRLRTLRALSVLGTLLVLLFLVYDELESDLMLPAYALLLIAAFAVHRLAKLRGYHQKYIQYRLLAEALRVQIYWQAAGVRERVGEQYTWAQRHDFIWVKEALSALDTGSGEEKTPLPDGIQVLRRCWIDAQRRYHGAAQGSKQRRLAQNDRISRVLLIASILLFVLVFVLEFAAKSVMTAVVSTEGVESVLMMHAGQDITMRGVLKILLGIVSAGTALISNYFSKLSLPVQARDNAKMAELYGMAADALDRAEQAGDELRARRVFYHVGRESLVENGSWMLDFLEQAPDIII